MRGYEYKGLVVPDFDYLSEGVRRLHAPAIKNVIQVNTHEGRDSDILLEVSKLGDELFVDRPDGVGIQFAVGGYSVHAEGKYLLDGDKAIADVFYGFVTNLRFERNSDGLWNAKGDNLELLHPLRLQIAVAALGTFLVKRPPETELSSLDKDGWINKNTGLSATY